MRLPIVLLTACALAAGHQSGAPPEGTIAGQVLNQATGTPLADAIVKLRYLDPSGANDDVQTAQTNALVRFEFTGLWGHDWELSAERSGFATAWYHASKYAPRGGFTLDRNQKLDSIVLKLAAQAVVTGKVWNGNEPIEGARVTLLAAGTRQEIASVATLDNGEYRIPRVPTGRYLVQAAIPAQPEVKRTPEESVASGFAPTYYPNTTDAAAAVAIDITGPTELRGIDIHLSRTRLYHVRGALHVSENWHVQVTLVDRADRSVVARTALNPPNLAFDFPFIPPGSYMIYGQGSAPPCNFCLGTQAVEVQSQDVDAVLLNLVNAKVPGVVKFPSTDRPAGWNRILMTANLLNLGQVASPGQYSQIDKDLTFQAIGSFPQNFAGFTIKVSRLPDGCYVESIHYGGADLPESGSVFIPNAMLEIAIGTDGGHIDGAVSGSDDQPQANAVVTLISANGKRAPQSLPADDHGGFHFAGVAPGDYKLLAFDDVSRDDLANPAFLQQFDSQATAVWVAAGGAASASLKIVSQ